MDEFGWTSLEVQLLRLCDSTAGGTGELVGELRSHVLLSGAKKKKKKKHEFGIQQLVA